MPRPLFSIIHPSARPDQWRKVYDDWTAKCRDASQVEYVLVADERWGFDPSGPKIQGHAPFENLRMIWNNGRRCYVDAVAAGAKAATGHILIVIADDQFACEHWDVELIKVLDNWVADQPGELPAVAREFVMEVSTGTPDEHQRGIFVMPIVSRVRYERLGYLFYPEYESMYADNDLCEHARQDGVVIDARALMFPHRHNLWTPGVYRDEATEVQNRPEAFRLGKSILNARRRCGFKTRSEAHSYFSPTETVQFPVSPLGQNAGAQGVGELRQSVGYMSLPKKPTLVICYPGENFPGDFVDGLLNLCFAAAQHFVVQPLRAYTTNPYMTRMELCSQVLRESPAPDFVLWIDDDNVATPEQLFTLLRDLEEHPDVDAMAGWCWIHIADKHLFLPSCGVWHENGTHITPYEGRLWQKETAVRRIDWTGFPFLLMRGRTLERAGGRDAFLPIIDPSLPNGMSGEDIAWCKRAGQRGLILAADPRVRVDHLKVVSAEPYEGPIEVSRRESAEEVQSKRAGVLAGAREPRIAAMLRVKNEARWIGRVIKSLIPLCDAGIFVMDDGSTDDTRKICEVLGAHVSGNPHAGELDEARDKNYLMTHVIGASNPDWILCIDGDEELEQGVNETIRAALRNTLMDAFTLNVPYLWNSPYTIRVDGLYRDVKRHSLFRPLPGLKFQSLYAGSKHTVHTGLHTGNVPVWVRNPEKTGILEAHLWHYGYMLKEDRIRKYKWYNQVDPHNAIENEYRHIVQGDIPEVPADQLWVNVQGKVIAGPLKLEHVKNGPQGMNAPHLVTLPVSTREHALRLNLGCSDRVEKGWLNVDICEPDAFDAEFQCADLRQAWPWETGSVSEIRAWDIIEHLPDKIHTMNEAFRVLKPGGIIDIIVPTTEGRGAFQDPTHVSYWNRNSFFYFESGNPHLHRFEKAYGMRCSFRVVMEKSETLQDGVTKLHITLEAVKREALADAAD